MLLDLNLDEEVSIKIPLYHLKEISESVKDFFVIAMWDFQWFLELINNCIQLKAISVGYIFMQYSLDNHHFWSIYIHISLIWVWRLHLLLVVDLCGIYNKLLPWGSSSSTTFLGFSTGLTNSHSGSCIVEFICTSVIT